jgi:hypothetical protein
VSLPWKRWLSALVISIVLVTCAWFLPDRGPAFETFGYLNLPGMLGAAVIAPEGIHSDTPYLFLYGSAVVNVAFYFWLVLMAYRFWGMARRRFGSGQP